MQSPSSRGRGLKSWAHGLKTATNIVALFTRAWIEMTLAGWGAAVKGVALFTRAWIEILVSTPL